MNYYQHHIGDYTRDTAHLTMIEDGAYRRLIDLCYATEKPLPVDPRAIYRLVRAGTKEERDAVDIVLAEFFDKGPDGWRQKRCEEEIAKARDKSGKARTSAGKRWQGGRNANAPLNHANALKDDANAMRTHTDSDANAPPDDAKAMRIGCEGNAPSTPIAITPLTPHDDEDANASDGKRSRRRPATPAPPSFDVSESMWAWAEAEGVLPDEIPRETENFLDRHRAKDSKFSDWEAAWRTWMRNVVKFRKGRAA